MKVSESQCIQRYKCLMQDCELPCCQGWKVSLSKDDVEKWKANAPQLMKFVHEETDKNGKIEYSVVRDENKRCLKNINGICEIQIEYGEDMIPNLCAYFPHIYKKMKDGVYSSATMACPAVVEAILTAKSDDWKITEYERKYTRNEMSNFSDRENGITFEEIKELHYKFLSIFDNKDYLVDECMFILTNISYNSKNLQSKDIIKKFDNLYKTAKENLENFDKNYNHINTQYKVLSTMEYIQSTRNNLPDLNSMFLQIKKCLGIDQTQSLTSEKIADCIDTYETIRYRWKNEIENLVNNPIRNVMKAQLNYSFFPFGSYFNNHNEMMIIIGFYYLFLRLVMMCEIMNASSAKSLKNLRRIVSVISRTFYGSSSLSTYNKLKDKKWDLPGVLDNAILRY